MDRSKGTTRTFAPLALAAIASLAACSSASSSPSPNAAAPGGDSNAAPGGSNGGTTLGGDAGSATSSNDAGASNASDASTGPAITTVRIHYPAGAHSIALRGSASPFTWTSGAKLTSGTDDTWTFTSSAIAAAFECKPLLDDATWSLGPNYKITPGVTNDIYPRFSQQNGTWSRAYDFASTTLKNSRGIWIYLPPTYVENTRAPMPVVYMHDGQNLFDPNVAFGGNAWNVAQAMDGGANDGTVAEAIVIGIENTADRIPEYTPVADPQDGGGNGDAYLTMIVTELKPKIDADLRTIPDRAHTAILGSSLGGLISAYAGVTHAETFGLVGVMSPSTWWDNDWLLMEVGKTPASPRPLRIYVDSGDSGTDNDDVTLTKTLADDYRAIGYQDGSSFDYLVQAGGQHNEVYWAQRLPGALRFLLGPGR